MKMIAFEFLLVFGAGVVITLLVLGLGNIQTFFIQLFKGEPHEKP